MWLQFLLYFIVFKHIQSEKILRSDTYEIESKLLELAQTIEQQHDIRTIIIKYDESVQSCGELVYYVRHFNATVIIENLRKSWFLKGSLNANLLCIVCLKKLTPDYKIELEPYFGSLRSMRDTKMLLYMNHNASAKYLSKLEEFFKYCWLRKSLNVLAVFKDFPRTRHLYAYTPFPNFTLEIHRNKVGDKLYPDRVKNLMGHIFYTLPDQAIPRTFLTVTKNGKVKISGYVGHFIHLLAQRLNATLKFPFPIKKGEILFYGYLEGLTRNYTIDLPGTLAPVIDVRQLFYYSYPFGIMNACLMIPQAEDMPLKKVFFYLVNLEMSTISITNLYLFTLLLNFKRLNLFRKHEMAEANHPVKFADYILNDVALRGILGQPFKVWLKAGFFIKFIYILLSLTGLYLSLIYSAFLQTIFTQPFKEKQLKTFEDLYANNIYTLLSDREVSYFKGANTNVKLLHRITSYEEYNSMRNGLNTSYAYPTTNINWNSLYNYQQTLFKNKLFIFSEDACVFHTNMLSFPLAENSIYRVPVHNLIMTARDHGLINRWLTINFPDELSIEKPPNLFDSSVTAPCGRALTVQDFELVLLMYVGLMAVAILSFFIEITFSRVKRTFSKRIQV